MGRTQRLRKRKFASEGDTTSFVDLCKYLGTLGWKNETHLCLKSFKSTGRGLCSKRATTEEDVLVKVPFEALISVYTLEDDEIFRDELFPRLKEKTFHFQALLAFYILWNEHRKTPRYLPYLETIPKEFTNPFFCLREELYFLPENILKETVEQNHKIKNNFEMLKECLSGHKCSCCEESYFPNIFTLELFKWAYFAVNSRCVYIDLSVVSPLKEKSKLRTILKDEPSFGLAPLIDLLNHSDSAGTIAKMKKQGNLLEYELQTCKHFRRYEQVFISYGSLPNNKLLVDYGFFLINNKHDLFEFSLSDLEGMIKTSKTLNAKSIHRNKFKFLADHNLDQQLFVHRTDGLSHNLKVVLYVVFKAETHFSNILSELAFGSHELFDEAIKDEAKLLVEFKIFEYQGYLRGLGSLPKLSASGQQCLGYIKECISYLSNVLNKFHS